MYINYFLPFYRNSVTENSSKMKCRREILMKKRIDLNVVYNNGTILETCDLMKQTAILTSSSKSTFNAKPKLKEWTPEIKSALNISRQKYKVWKKHGKPWP